MATNPVNATTPDAVVSAIRSAYGDVWANAVAAGMSNSPYFAGLMEVFVGSGGTFTNSSGNGSTGGAGSISISGSLLPGGNNQPDPSLIPVILAHEVTHNTPVGTAEGGATTEQSVTSLVSSEGAAFTAEVIVANQLNVGTYSGSTDEPGFAGLVASRNQAVANIDALATSSGIDLGALTFGSNAANGLLTNQYGSAFMAGAPASIAPNLSYSQLGAAFDVVQRVCPAATADQVDWSQVTAAGITQNANGTWAFDNVNIPLVPAAGQTVGNELLINGASTATSIGGGFTGECIDLGKSSSIGSPPVETVVVTASSASGPVIDPSTVSATATIGNQTITLLDLGGSSPFALISNDNSVSTAGAVSSNGAGAPSSNGTPGTTSLSVITNGTTSSFVAGGSSGDTILNCRIM